jgi:hypothetical protein
MPKRLERLAFDSMSNVRSQQCNYGARMGREQERSSKDEAKIQQTLRISNAASKRGVIDV